MECVKENIVPCDVSLCINPLNYLMGLLHNIARDGDLSSADIYRDAYSTLMNNDSIILSNVNSKYCCPDCNSEHGFYFLGSYTQFKSIIVYDGLNNDNPQHHELLFDASRKFECCVNLALPNDQLIDYQDDTFILTRNKAICFGYGHLYNFNVISGTKSVVNAIDGWKIPSQLDLNLLVNYLGGTFEAGGKLKELGESNSTSHWQANVGATNKSKFSALGAGFMDETGTYDQLRYSFSMWTTTVDPTDSTKAIALKILNSDSNANIIGLDKKRGLSIRLVRPATLQELTLVDGSSSLENPTLISSYTGNDGKVYATVKIGTQVWLMENLAETKYSDNTNIAFSDDTTWVANSSTISTYTFFPDFNFQEDCDTVLRREPCFDLYDKTPPCCKTNFNESLQRLRYDATSDSTYSKYGDIIEANSFNSRSGIGIILDNFKRANPEVTKEQIDYFFGNIFYEYGLVIKCIGCDIYFFTTSGYRDYLQTKSIV
ncbi:MAG: hypothetical protein RIR01_2387 [Bacteroidota bacterium]|jgi:uncharacterized protein (TIGR02145 family)